MARPFQVDDPFQKLRRGEISHKLFDCRVLPISVCVTSGTLPDRSQRRSRHTGHTLPFLEPVKWPDCRVLPISVCV